MAVMGKLLGFEACFIGRDVISGTITLLKAHGRGDHGP